MCLLTIAAYGPSLSGGFVYEDWWQTPREVVARALVRRSQDVTAALFGAGPRAARTVSLAWHLLNGCLLWLLARRVMATTAAVMAAGLCLLHPLQTEAVAYLSSRPELAAATWVLLALLAVESERLWLAWLCAALVITGKEVAVTVWLLVPAWAYLRGQWWSRGWVAIWAVTTGIVAGVFAIRAWQVFGHLWSPWAVAAQWAELARLVVLVPDALVHPSALTIDHDWTWITKPIAVGAVVGWVGLAVVLWRTWRWGAAAVALPAIALLPRLLMPMPDGIHERHLYIPMMGLSLALGAWLMPKETR